MKMILFNFNFIDAWYNRKLHLKRHSGHASQNCTSYQGGTTKLDHREHKRTIATIYNGKSVSFFEGMHRTVFRTTVKYNRL